MLVAVPQQRLLRGGEQTAVDGLATDSSAVGAIPGSTAVRRRHARRRTVVTEGRVVRLRVDPEANDLGTASSDTKRIVRMPGDAWQPAEHVLETTSEPVGRRINVNRVSLVN